MSIISDLVKLTAVEHHENPNISDSQYMDHWRVTLRYGKRQMTLYYSQGDGFGGAKPTVEDVLDCLRSEASSTDLDFEEWCCEYGLDVGSRKAERTYEATVKQTEKLRRLFGEDYQIFMDEE